MGQLYGQKLFVTEYEDAELNFRQKKISLLISHESRFAENKLQALKVSQISYPTNVQQYPCT